MDENLSFTGILETVVYCGPEDEAATRAFYRHVLGLRPVGLGGNAFRVAERQVLLLFDREKSFAPGDPPAHGATGRVHTCFVVEAARYTLWKRHLRDAGVAITREITWGRGVTSFYFEDPAGNVLEIANGDLWPR